MCLFAPQSMTVLDALLVECDENECLPVRNTLDLGRFLCLGPIEARRSALQLVLFFSLFC